MKLNELTSEKIKNKELNLEKSYKIFGKDVVDERLKNLEESDFEILSKYNIQEMKKAVKDKILNSKKESRYFFNTEKIIKFSSIAAILFVVVGVFSARFIREDARLDLGANDSATRVKGNVHFQQSSVNLILYRKTLSGAEILKNGDIAKSGDIIQISYLSGCEKYGLIFSVDGNGIVTKHFPEDSWNASLLQKNETLLDFSYQLDDAPSFESFVFVSSKKSFDLSEEEAMNIVSDSSFIKNNLPELKEIEIRLNK